MVGLSLTSIRQVDDYQKLKDFLQGVDGPELCRQQSKIAKLLVPAFKNIRQLSQYSHHHQQLSSTLASIKSKLDCSCLKLHSLANLVEEYEHQMRMKLTIDNGWLK